MNAPDGDEADKQSVSRNSELGFELGSGSLSGPHQGVVVVAPHVLLRPQKNILSLPKRALVQATDTLSLHSRALHGAMWCMEDCSLN